MRTPTQSRPVPAATGQPVGRSIVAGQTVSPPSSPVAPADSKFYAVDPHSGDELGVMYLAATEEDVDNACWASWRAFHLMGEKSAADRGVRAGARRAHGGLSPIFVRARGKIAEPAPRIRR